MDADERRSGLDQITEKSVDCVHQATALQVCLLVNFSAATATLKCVVCGFSTLWHLYSDCIGVHRRASAAKMIWNLN
jgi:hypothetical protein